MPRSRTEGPVRPNGPTRLAALLAAVTLAGLLAAGLLTLRLNATQAELARYRNVWIDNAHVNTHLHRCLAELRGEPIPDGVGELPEGVRWSFGVAPIGP